NTAATFSTAFPAIDTITRPAKVSEICSVLIVGVSAWMNQSDTNADARPPMMSSAALVTDDWRGLCSATGTAGCVRRDWTTHNVYVARIATAPMIEIVLVW